MIKLFKNLFRGTKHQEVVGDCGLAPQSLNADSWASYTSGVGTIIKLSFRDQRDAKRRIRYELQLNIKSAKELVERLNHLIKCQVEHDS